jgi:hypothetical protein
MDSTTTSPTTTPPSAIDHAARASSIRSVAPFSTNEPRWIRSLAGAFEAREIHPQTIVYTSLVAGVLAALFLPVGPSPTGCTGPRPPSIPPSIPASPTS